MSDFGCGPAVLTYSHAYNSLTVQNMCAGTRQVKQPGSDMCQEGGTETSAGPKFVGLSRSKTAANRELSGVILTVTGNQFVVGAIPMPGIITIKAGHLPVVLRICISRHELHICADNFTAYFSSVYYCLICISHNKLLVLAVKERFDF